MKKILSISKVADHVRRRCDQLAAAHPDDDAFPVKLPPGDGLRHLLEEAFWASISRDEGRQCRFTVAYYGRDEKESDADVAVALEPEPFDRGRLRRLAAVASAADAEIAVSLVSGDLRIIGLCKQFRMYLRWASIPEVSNEHTMPIEIEVRGPGHIFVRYGIFRILTYVNGEISQPGPNVLDMEGPLRAALADLAMPEGLPSTDVRSYLKTLLHHLDRHGHGGLLILSGTEPNGCLEPISWRITNHVYSLSDVERIRSESSKRLHLPKDDPNRVSFFQLGETQRALQALARDILKLSASLALTDGGVWLDGGLRPRAFGVFTSLETNRRISIAKDAAGTDLQTMTFARLGARHRALVALAGHNPGCPTIAVSVDGGFSAALQVKDREDVLVWKFQSWDLQVDDPFDPQYGAIWKDILRPM